MLKEAIEALGLTYSVHANGDISVNTTAGRILIKTDSAELNKDAQSIFNKIKQSYASAAIKAVAKKYKFTTSVKENNKIVLRRY